MQIQTIDHGYTDPSLDNHGVAGDPSDGHGERLQAVATTKPKTLYTPEFCLKAIHTLTSNKTGLNPTDVAVLCHLIAKMTTHHTSWISDVQLGEILGCDRRVIADSYKRLKADGWIHRTKNMTRSPKDRGRKIIDRKPATVTVNFYRFPEEVQKADPVTEDAKQLAAMYQAAIVKAGLSEIGDTPLKKAARRISSRGKALLAHEQRAAQNLLAVFGGDVGQTLAFVNYAINHGHKAALQGLSHLYRQRKIIVLKFEMHNL